MTGVLVWKELREQWTSAVAVLALGVVLFVSFIALSDYSGPRFDATTGLLFCLAWVCGLVAGVQPFANEFESGTLTWLDSLPVARRTLWRAKAGAAGGVAAIQVIVLFALMTALGGLDPIGNPVRTLSVAMLFALSGLSGGLLGSALARTALGAFGWGILVQFGIGWILAFFASAWSVGSGPPDARDRRESIMDLLFVALSLSTAAAPLVISARSFGRLDRLRKAGKTNQSIVSETRAIAWLTWQQSRVVRWVVVGAGLALAISVPMIAPHLWPAFGLLLGVIAGAGTFGADQAGSACRFLGDRRVPPGRLWLVKHLVRIGPLAVVVAAYFLIGWMRILAIQWDLTSVMRSAGDAERIETLLRDFNPNLVLIGPVFGYALGQCFGLICRKEAVAAVLAILTASGVWFLWFPSLVIGGVFVWQWILPPLLLIAVTRPAIWPWATGRLATWRPVIGLGSAVVVAVTLSLAGVAYRVIEAPLRTAPFDVAAFEATLPKPEQNEAGREITQAILQFQKALNQADADFGQNVWEPNDTRPKFIGQAGDAVRDGVWPANSGKFDRWLDTILADRWLEQIRTAVQLPLGRANLSETYSLYHQRLLYGAGSVGTLIEARALRRITRGEIEPALEDIALVLDLSRQLESNANSEQYLYAANWEKSALDLLPKWGAAAADRPDLLRRAIDMLRLHEERRPPISNVVKLEYLKAAEPRTNQPANVEEALYLLSLHTPWEEIRTNAILNTWFAGVLRTAEMGYPEALTRIGQAVPPVTNPTWWMLADWVPPSNDPAAARREARNFADLMRTSKWWNANVGVGPHLFGADARARVYLRAAQYQLALILYQTRFGKTAENVQALVPDFLPSLPADPFGDGPFHYRVSKGERIHWLSDRIHDDDEGAYRVVAAGEGILWSNGSDLRDDGGQRNEGYTWLYRGVNSIGDMLFIVPVVNR
jgi:ABC-type transport system involved in multi-copper enzyme maturation permease subunit